jgi:hypothetical protein
MYNEHNLARRRSLISLARFGKNLGRYEGLNGNSVELTREDEDELTYCANRVYERVDLLERSNIDDTMLTVLSVHGWSSDKCISMFQGFHNSYDGLMETNSLDFGEKSYADLFFADSVDYAAKLERYANRFCQYNDMNWDAKPQPRNPMPRETRKGLLGFLRGLGKNK